MKKDISVKNNKINKKEVNYIKKYNYKMKMLKFILISIFIIIFIILARKAIIIATLQNKVKDYIGSTNYIIFSQSYNFMNTSIAETYHKDGKTYSYFNILNHNEETPTKKQIITTSYAGKHNLYMTNGNNKIALLNKKGEALPASLSVINTLKSNTIGMYLRNLLLCSISTTKCNGEDCYQIDNFINDIFLYPSGGGKITFYISKDTGLLIRAVGEAEVGSSEDTEYRGFSSITDYRYEFNTVTDENMKEPDISGYTIN